MVDQSAVDGSALDRAVALASQAPSPFTGTGWTGTRDAPGSLAVRVNRDLLASGASPSREQILAAGVALAYVRLALEAQIAGLASGRVLQVCAGLGLQHVFVNGPVHSPDFRESLARSLHPYAEPQQLLWIGFPSLVSGGTSNEFR